LEIVLKETVGGSLSGFDLTFHDPVFFAGDFSLKSVDLVIKVSFWCGLLLLLLLIIELNFPEMIKVVLNMFVSILTFFLIFKLFLFIFFSFGLLVSKLFLELLEFFLIELVIIAFEILVIFIELLSVETDVFL